MKLTKSILAAAFAFTAVTNAQETNKFSLSGEFRPRTEMGGAGGPFTKTPATPGGSTATTANEAFIKTSVRAALNAKYTTDSYTTYLGLQEVFFFGDREQISPKANMNGGIRVQEAWADIKLGDYSSLKVGRQPLSYDDQRILGGLGWAQQARTHDAAVFKYKNDGYSLDLGGSLNTYAGPTYNTSKLFSYRDMGFIRANKKYGALNVSALALVNTFQNGTPTAVSPAGSNKATLVTAGLHADYKSGIVGLSANAYIQEGDRLVGGYQKISGAYLASLDATIKADDNLTVLAGTEVISGTDADSGAFFPLYGTNHKFNGLIDRFYVGNHANGSGLIDMNLGLSTKVSGVALKAKFHKFLGESNSNEDLGSELDLVVAKKFNGFKLVGGYSYFIESEKVANNPFTRDTQNWAWLMLIIKPNFL